MMSLVNRVMTTVAIAVCSFTSAGAQEHMSSHAVEFQDSPAGRTTTAGRPTHLLYSPDPAYTDAARAAKIKGTVVLEGLLGTDGCLRETKVLRYLGYGLDESAIEAVQKWKFRTFEKGGVPTGTRIRIEVNFDPLWSPDRADFSKASCGSK